MAPKPKLSIPKPPKPSQEKINELIKVKGEKMTGYASNPLIPAPGKPSDLKKMPSFLRKTKPAGRRGYK